MIIYIFNFFLRDVSDRVSRAHVVERGGGVPSAPDD